MLAGCGGDGIQCRACAEDTDAAERAEIEQIAIPGDDEGGAGGERTGEHVVIVEIAADGR